MVQLGLVIMNWKISTSLILAVCLAALNGCGGRSDEWKKGRDEYVKEREREEHDSHAESELSQTKSFEGREFLKDKRSVIEGVDREYADNLVEKFYNSGAKKVLFTSVTEKFVTKKVKGKKKKYVSKRIASVLVVELPELFDDRERAFAAEAKFAEKLKVEPMKDVDQKYLVLELD
jgi:hypothetical protein